jgi:RNA polymerase subunit RPABC4/transcription elongation factor Spt4
VLQVKDSLAGKAVVCPVCQSRIEIPKPHEGEFSEDAILDLLGPHDSVPSPHTAPEDSDEWTKKEEPTADVAMGPPPKKTCPRCDRSVDAGTRVCPYCNTYIVGY